MLTLILLRSSVHLHSALVSLVDHRARYNYRLYLKITKSHFHYCMARSSFTGARTFSAGKSITFCMEKGQTHRTD